MVEVVKGQVLAQFRESGTDAGTACMCFSVLLTADTVHSCTCERQRETEEGRLSLVYLNKRVSSSEDRVKGRCNCSVVQSAGSDLFRRGNDARTSGEFSFASAR